MGREGRPAPALFQVGRHGDQGVPATVCRGLPRRAGAEGQARRSQARWLPRKPSPCLGPFDVGGFTSSAAPQPPPRRQRAPVDGPGGAPCGGCMAISRAVAPGARVACLLASPRSAPRATLRGLESTPQRGCRPLPRHTADNTISELGAGGVVAGVLRPSKHPLRAPSTGPRTRCDDGGQVEGPAGDEFAPLQTPRSAAAGLRFPVSMAFQRGAGRQHLRGAVLGAVTGPSRVRPWLPREACEDAPGPGASGGPRLRHSGRGPWVVFVRRSAVSTSRPAARRRW
jgi:hypothetical protein